MSKTICIVGKIYPQLLHYLVSHGYQVAVISDQPLPLAYADQVKYFIQVSFETKDALFSQLHKQELPIDAAITTYENYVIPNSWICEFYHLPGIDETTAKFLTDKYLMREAFSQKRSQLNPYYSMVTDWDQLARFAHQYGFPLMLKPTNLVKSLLVTKNNNMDELRQNYELLEQNIAKTYLENDIKYRNPQVIVEQFLKGSMHTVAGFVDSLGTTHLVESVADIVTAQSRGEADNYLYSRSIPSNLSPSQVNQLFKATTEALDSMNIRSTPIHAELMFDHETNTAKIIEIGARIGGYRPLMYTLANEVDMYGAQIKIAMGELPDLSIRTPKATIVIELFPHQRGAFKTISFLKELKQLPTLYKLTVNSQPGDVVGYARDGYRACAYIVLAGNSLAELATDYQFILDKVKVVTT